MAFCCEIEPDFEFGGDDCFPMHLMSNENITWTVDRERGISFDLTALTDPESRLPPDEDGAFPPNAADAIVTREIKLEAAESGVKESTFGHPFGGQCRPQPRPAPSSPFSRGIAACGAANGGGGGPLAKRTRPLSFDLSDPSPLPKRQQHGGEQQDEDQEEEGGGTGLLEGEDKPVLPQHQPCVLGRTRSRSMRPSPPISAAAAAAAAAPSAASPGRTKSGGGRVKHEAAEARAAAAAGPRRRLVGGIDTMALTAELGLVDRRRCARRGKGGVPYKVGAYTLEERAALVARFHAKRGRRIWRKKIKYDCRKKLADKRPRLKGRFVTQEELEGLDSETLAKVTGLGPWPEDSNSGDDAGETSDGSEGYTGPKLTTSRYTKEGPGDRTAAAVAPPVAAAPGPIPAPSQPRKSFCAKVAAAAKASAKSKAAAMEGGDDDDDDQIDFYDGGSSTSAASEESDIMPPPEVSIGGGAIERVSSSSKVSALFAVKTEADVDVMSLDDQHEQQRLDVQPHDDDDNDMEIKVEEFEPSDPVFGFMVDDIMSSSFNVVPSRDLEAMSAEVTVN